MGALEGAVGDLQAALEADLCSDDADPPQCEQSLKDSMDDLAGIARQIAEDALDEAIACDPANPDLDAAQQALDEGDVLRALEAFKDAVNKYKDALAKAEGVLSSCP